MKELTFTSFEEYKDYIQKKMNQKAKNRGLEGEERVQFINQRIKEALKLWEENNFQQSIEEDGFVLITVWRDEEGVRKIRRGRPKKPECEKLKHSIHVRLDEDTYNKLHQYCDSKQLDKSEVIRNLINQLN